MYAYRFFLKEGQISKYSAVRDKLGFLTIEPKPTAEILSHHYSTTYYHNPRGTYSATYSKEEVANRISKFRLRLFAIQQQSSLLGNSQKALDIGCGEGFMLSYLRQQGFSITGLDYSSEGIRRHNPEILNYLIQGDVMESMEDLVSQNHTFDLLVVGNVLEHAINVEAFLSRIKTLMHPESVCIFAVPNDESDFQTLLQSSRCIDGNYFLSPPEHLNYFNSVTLRNVLEHYGFVLLDLFSEFPIEWFLANPNSNYVNKPQFGPGAHAARCLIETSLNDHADLSEVLLFYRTLAKLGHGRVLNAICRLI